MEWTARRILRDDEFTVVTWRQMLVDVGGMSEADFAVFLSYWKGWVARDDSGLFEHETEGWYAAPHLIPKHLREAYPHGGCLVPLTNWIHTILDTHFHRQKFTPDRVPQIRAEIQAAIAEWVATHSAEALKSQERIKRAIDDAGRR
jgi:hypothetical protein